MLLLYICSTLIVLKSFVLHFEIKVSGCASCNVACWMSAVHVQL